MNSTTPTPRYLAQDSLATLVNQQIGRFGLRQVYMSFALIGVQRDDTD